MHSTCSECPQPRLIAVVLQDHSFGGPDCQFGAGSSLEALAIAHNALPSWLLVAENTRAWAGYHSVPGAIRDIGGQHSMRRHLYEVDSQPE